MLRLSSRETIMYAQLACSGGPRHALETWVAPLCYMILLVMLEFDRLLRGVLAS